MLVSVWSVAKLAKPISKRRKRWAPRTRTGCTTCRSRRIKCDEARPECLRCISSNRTCGGYSTAALTLNPSTQVCPLGREPPHEEVLMFGLLRDEALSRLTGSVVTQLWSHDVLQATQSYPAVWHAGLAMAAMHKRKKIQGDSEYAVQSRNNYYSFSLRNYNASIKHLMEIIGQKQLSDQDRETVLIASVLFLSLCSLQNHAKEAILHAQSGANLYYQWEMCDSKVEAGRNGILSLESLTILMATLECAHIAPIGQYTMAKKWYWKLRPLPDNSSVPFNSLSEAYADFIPLLNLIIDQGRSADSKRLFSTAKHDNPSVWNRYQQEFRVWRDKFRDFQLSWTPNDDELGVVLELEMFSKLFDLIFGEISRAIEMHWDSCTQEFEEIVDIGEQMWQLQTKTAKKYDEQEGTFTLSLSPGEVLYFVVASCRDGDVRSRAISLMKKWKRRNGVWDTTTIAALCETLVMYEEGAASDDDWCECVSGKFICHGHRTAWIKGGFREDGEMVMRMKSVHDVKNDKPGVKYVLHF